MRSTFLWQWFRLFCDRFCGLLAGGNPFADEREARCILNHHFTSRFELIGYTRGISGNAAEPNCCELLPGCWINSEALPVCFGHRLEVSNVVIDLKGDEAR